MPQQIDLDTITNHYLQSQAQQGQSSQIHSESEYSELSKEECAAVLWESVRNDDTAMREVVRRALTRLLTEED